MCLSNEIGHQGIADLRSFDGELSNGTAGAHWPLIRALNKEELDTLLRTGTCMGCHQNMINKEINM